jgi:hypothetical protein
MSDLQRLLSAVQLLTEELNVESVTFGFPEGVKLFEQKNIAIPDSIAQYLTHIVPSKSFHDEGLRFLGGRDFLAQNTTFSPAIFIREFGFWTVATFLNGDGYCWDTVTGRLVLVDTGQFFYRKKEGRIVGQEGSITRGSIDAVAEVQASSFEAFVEWMATGESE